YQVIFFSINLTSVVASMVPFYSDFATNFFLVVRFCSSLGHHLNMTTRTVCIKYKWNEGDDKIDNYMMVKCGRLQSAVFGGQDTSVKFSLSAERGVGGKDSVFVHLIQCNATSLFVRVKFSLESDFDKPYSRKVRFYETSGGNIAIYSCASQKD